jgi:hypothetical protein
MLKLEIQRDVSGVSLGYLIPSVNFMRIFSVSQYTGTPEAKLLK